MLLACGVPTWNVVWYPMFFGVVVITGRSSMADVVGGVEVDLLVQRIGSAVVVDPPCQTRPSGSSNAVEW